MIYEVRTYVVKPRSLPEVVKRFGEKYEQRKKYSELAAFFQTEVGPLNQFFAGKLLPYCHAGLPKALLARYRKQIQC